MADIQQLLLPLTTVAKIVFDFVSSLIIPIIQFLFGLGEVMFAKIFIVCILTIALQKAVIKLVKSPSPALIIAFLISLLGIRIIPDSGFTSLMAGWYTFAVLGVFMAFTLFFRTVWWQRKGIMLVLIALFTAFWYFYGRNTKFIILAIILLLFLIFDTPIHKALAPLRKFNERKEEIDAQIKIKEKEINDMIVAGTDAKSSAIANRQKEIDDLIKEKSKL